MLVLGRQESGWQCAMPALGRSHALLALARLCEDATAAAGMHGRVGGTRARACERVHASAAAGEGLTLGDSSTSAMRLSAPRVSMCTWVPPRGEGWGARRRSKRGREEGGPSGMPADSLLPKARKPIYLFTQRSKSERGGTPPHPVCVCVRVGQGGAHTCRCGTASTPPVRTQVEGLGGVRGRPHARHVPPPGMRNPGPGTAPSPPHSPQSAVRMGQGSRE